MKAITMYQPWATLVALRAKKYETRSWGTSHRGLLAIHAAKTTKYLYLINTEPFTSVFRIPNNRVARLPMGAILAVVNLVDVFPTEDVLDLLEGDERAFGDFSPGRKAWELELKQRLESPIPARGKQGLWNWVFEGT